MDRTLLFPEGGGQPSDHGRVAGQPVLDLRRREDGAVVHVLARPVSGRVEVEVDWPRRYDHMQQHTAQHLLTAVALDRYGLRTTAFHLGAEHSDIELDCADLSPEQIHKLEALVNAHVRENRAVMHRWSEHEELARLGVRSRALPADLSGPVRLVEIEGVDLNTCGGTHVARTGELQAVKLLHTEHLRGGTRLFYLAGGRVLEALDAALGRERGLNRVLSCGPDQHLTAVENIREEAQKARRTLKRARLRLAEYIGRDLADEAGVATLYQPDGDMAFLSAVALAVRARSPEHWLFLTAGQGAGVFLLSGPADAVKAVGPAVAEALAGRGGGPDGVFQGKASQLDRRADALALVRAAAGE